MIYFSFLELFINWGLDYVTYSIPLCLRDFNAMYSFLFFFFSYFCFCGCLFNVLSMYSMSFIVKIIASFDRLKNVPWRKQVQTFFFLNHANAPTQLSAKSKREFIVHKAVLHEPQRNLRAGKLKFFWQALPIHPRIPTVLIRSFINYLVDF